MIGTFPEYVLLTLKRPAIFGLFPIDTVVPDIIINRKTRRLIFDQRTVYKDKKYRRFPHSTDVFHIKIS